VAAQHPGEGKGPGGSIRQAAIAFELPVMLIAPAVVGGAVGFFLDRWLHTKPIFLLVLGILGVGLGIRDALKSASAQDKKDP
jgi:ATP synthase protein I